MAPSLPRRAAAEGFAAFALVFAGCGAIVSDTVNDGVLGAVGVSLVFGLVIMAMVYATGHWTCPASVDTLRLGIKPLSVVDL